MTEYIQLTETSRLAVKPDDSPTCPAATGTCSPDT